MPPRRFSRYTFATAERDAEGDLVLFGGEPFRYQLLPDTREHVVREGDTLFNLAARYFEGFDRPDGLWWVIADFQPDPIHDPTVALEVGRTVYVPTARVIDELVFSESRRSEG